MVSQEQFYRDTWVEVDLDCIKENVQQMKSRLPIDVEMMAVVKANGYGHGDVQVARTTLDAGASSLAVAFLDEALALRQKGIDAPILVLGATRADHVNVAAKNNITLTVFQEEWIREIGALMEKDVTISVHLKLDTGMGRIGIRDESTLQKIERLINEDDRIQLEGVFTHFATADSLDLSYFEEQLARFKEMVEALHNKPKMIHASNSAAALRTTNYFNGIRYGIAMYGLTPSVEIKGELPFPLKEAFSLRTTLVHVKKLAPGDKVSYGGTYEAKEEEWIGTLPIGYADGWIRRLQGQEVLIDGMRVPIVGRICMDQCMIKLPKELPIGTVVTLIGWDKKEHVSIDELAERLDTINYEIPCTISSRVPRIYVKSGKTIDVKNGVLQA
ncbi:alanine racemase [Robertmurraya yapensis]|uniref:Alanine racemase n=1 Tax=Bacillus yapensis TaxID=2492960 RepID=A0A3S0JT83_9BACI|nr:alanine racemase [Bacillus yapensis]RTR28489.1 alanine racemase [Bacillus yapensis]TKS94550.1 alanine racemase [Bacillus yapensis]